MVIGVEAIDPYLLRGLIPISILDRYMGLVVVTLSETCTDGE